MDPGSVNVGLTSDGTVPGAAAPEPHQNSYADTEYMFARSAALRAAPSVSIFEPGFLRTAPTLHRHGRVPPGAIIKLYFGGSLEFGLPHRAGPRRLRRDAGAQRPAVVGGGAGRRRRPSNLELLDEATSLLSALGRRPATSAEARQLLGVPTPR